MVIGVNLDRFPVYVDYHVTAEETWFRRGRYRPRYVWMFLSERCNPG